MGGSDGSVVIDTELDQSGFEKGSDKLIKSLDNLTASLNSLGDKLTGAFQGVLPTLQGVSAGAGQMVAAMAAADSGAAQLRSGVASLDRDAASLTADLTKIETGIQNGFANPGAVLKFKDLMDGAEVKANDLRARMAELAAQRIPTEDYSFLSSAIKDAGDKLSALKDRQDKLREMGISENSRQWQSLAYDIEQVQGQIANYKAEMAELEASGGAFISGADTAQYQQMSALLQQTDEQLERGRALIDDEALSQAQLNVQAAQEEVIRAQTNSAREAALERLRGAQQELNSLAAELTQNGGGAPPPESSSRWSALGGVLRGCASALAAVAGGAVKAAGSLAKMGFKAVADGVKNLTSKLTSLVKTNKSAALSSNGLVRALSSVRTMLVSRVKRMFISYLMNEIKEAFSSLAQYSAEFDAAISGMKNSASQLAGNIAVAFSGLVNAVAPAITSIINLLSEATTYLNSFFAMLSGKSSVTVAKKKTDSYAKSLSGVSDAADEAEGSLASFDKLNTIAVDDGSGAGNGADEFEDVPIDSILPADLGSWFGKIKEAFSAGDWGGIGSLIADGLNTAMTTVDGWINGTLRPLATTWAGRVATLLNGLVDGFDGELLGKTVGDGINTITDTLNTFFTKFDFKILGTEFGNSINGLFDRIDWTTLAATVSKGIKGIFNSINAFLAEVDWVSVGSDIAVFLATIDWAGIAESVFTGLGAAFGAAAGLLWGLIKDAWSSVVEWWHETAYEDGEFTITGLLNGIWSKIKDIGIWIREHIFQPFIDGFKNVFGINSPSTVMAEQGGYIIDGLFNGISGAWHAITDFFFGVVSELKDWLSEKWTNIKEKASEKWSEIKEKISTKFTEAKNSITDTANEIKEKVSDNWADIKSTATTKWADIKSTVKEKWDSLKDDMGKKDWTSVGSDLVSGIKKGISDGWSAFSSWAGKKFSSITDVVKGVFDINSPSKVFAEIGEYLDQGLVVGLDEGMKGVLTTAKNLAGSITDAVSVSPEIDIASDTTVKGLTAVAQTLSGIADTFVGISRALSSMSGLKIPDIAAGTFVPYQTRIAPTNTAMEEADVGLSTMLELLREILSAIERIGDGDVNISVESILDGKIVAQSVIDQINKLTRRNNRSPLLT